MYDAATTGNLVPSMGQTLTNLGTIKDLRNCRDVDPFQTTSFRSSGARDARIVHDCPSRLVRIVPSRPTVTY